MLTLKDPVPIRTLSDRYDYKILGVVFIFHKKKISFCDYRRKTTNNRNRRVNMCNRYLYESIGCCGT